MKNKITIIGAIVGFTIVGLFLPVAFFGASIQTITLDRFILGLGISTIGLAAFYSTWLIDGWISK